MGYPMTWARVVMRNGLRGNYGQPDTVSGHLDERRRADIIAGDMRRLEADSRDERHLRLYAEIANCTPGHVKAVLDAFFGDTTLGGETSNA